MASLDVILDSISDALLGAENQANYACGGSIPISQTNKHKRKDFRAATTCPPITLRWESAQGTLQKIQFPPKEDSNEQYVSALAKLVDDCAPASFGRHGKNVYDETYRKATKRLFYFLYLMKP